ncbi:MAG: pyruvate kinase [Cytophagales bacterium]|nr:pyruvate kinase [Cytophagales bacterium]
MKIRTEVLEQLNRQISVIIDKTLELERKYIVEISSVHPVYNRSARNLIHYLAFRSFEMDILQDQLRALGLPSLTNIEGHVLESLLSIKTIINHLLGVQKVEHKKGVITTAKSKKILSKNTMLLFGYKSKKRRTRIMVTLPGIAAEEPKLIRRLLKAGMNSARINCAHDDPEVWKQMISHLDDAKTIMSRNCKVMMDLGGPKLRTGPMEEGPKVIHIRPERNDLGEVITPSRIWIAPYDVLPPKDNADAILPIDEQLFSKIKRGSEILFNDSRGKKCKILVDKKQGGGKWGLCRDSAYVTTGTEMEVHRRKKSGKEAIFVGELLPLEQSLTLKSGDTLILKKDQEPGRNATYDQGGQIEAPAFISCTLPEIFKYVKVGEPIFFDDGKIEGRIEEAHPEYLIVRILQAKVLGSKLKSDKGINLPESDLPISGLTDKDRQDMKFVIDHADAVNFSFVNDKSDVEELQDLMEELGKRIGIILKVETQKAFKNLPKILLQAMRSYPIGVMIARGDLAIETGWKNFASIQEEILRICEAAHIPDIWATQVLESMAKKGVPSRAEITDASMAQRAECVMLNKGIYIEKAVKLLDRILIKMQRYQKKQNTLLPKLGEADRLILEYY